MAKGLRAVHSRIIGVLVEDIRAFFVPEVISGITEYAESNGYHILLSDMHFLEKLLNKYEETMLYKDKINEQIAFLDSAQVDGIIYVAMHDRDMNGIIEDFNKPLVYAYCHSSDSSHLSVVYESESISYEITESLYHSGHRNIAVLTGPNNSRPSIQRLAGFKRAMADFNLYIPPENIMIGDWEYTSGYFAASKMIGYENMPDALFCFNDYMAIGALNAFLDAGIKVPEQISIIGFDKKDFTSFSQPRLSTVEVPFASIGLQSARLVTKLIEKQSIADVQTNIVCKIIRRESIINK